MPRTLRLPPPETSSSQMQTAYDLLLCSAAHTNKLSVIVYICTKPFHTNNDFHKKNFCCWASLLASFSPSPSSGALFITFEWSVCAESINTFSVVFLLPPSQSSTPLRPSSSWFPFLRRAPHRRFHLPLWETLFAGDLFTVEFLVHWIALNAIFIIGHWASLIKREKSTMNLGRTI